MKKIKELSWVITQKAKINIERNFKAMIEGVFTELEVKALLIDIRETLNAYAVLPQATQQQKDLLEIADFVAHPTKNKGRLIDTILNYAKPLYGVDSQFTGDKGFESRALVNELYSTVVKMLEGIGSNYTEDDRIKFLENAPDIGLCIISLLQSCVVFLQFEDHEGYGFFFIACDLGFYTLLCEFGCRDDLERIELKNSVVDIDQETRVHFQIILITTDKEGNDAPLHTGASTRIYETRRDSSNNLYLIDIGSSHPIKVEQNFD